MTFFKRLKYLLISLLLFSNSFLQAQCDPGVIAIDAGAAHSLALMSDGTVRAWGNNTSGQLGDGTNTNSSIPVQVVDGMNFLTDVIAIAAGNLHSLAIKSDGTVWAWGENSSGQLGNGSNTDSNVPVQVKDSSGMGNLSNIIAIAGGGEFSIALKSDGTVWTWGNNALGQLGDGTMTNRNLPVQVIDGMGFLTNIIGIGAGAVHSLAIKGDGTVRAWGNNFAGKLGNGMTGGNFTSPVVTLGISNVIAVAGALNHSLALLSDGTVWAWGQNLQGQLGNGLMNAGSNVPIQSNMMDAKAISADANFSIALKNDGTVWGWGGNVTGQLGNGTNTNSSVPVQAIGITDVKAIAAGGGHTLALKSDATVWSWGNNTSGQLGNGTLINTNVPGQTLNLTGIEGFQAIAGGGFHSLGLRSDGTVWAWGENNYGQLGNGTNIDSNIPVQVSGLTNVIAIAAGEFFSLALTSDGTVWAWGDNTSGQLGDGTNNNSNIPVQVSGLSEVIAIAAGSGHSVSLKSDGTVWTWGLNFEGQLGNGTNTDSTVPVQTINITFVKAISAGSFTTLAVRGNGSALAWGANGNGELGNGTNTNSNVPVLVSGLSTNVKRMAGGLFHSLALLSDGTLRAWGANFVGQLGNGTNTTTNVPVTVTGFTEAKAIAAGGNHSLALKSNGTTWAWGANSQGELGNGTNTNSNVPVQVTGFTAAKAISAGKFHSLALKSDGTIWAWGDNQFGQLGDGTNTDSNVPVATILTAVVFADPQEVTICSGETIEISLSSNMAEATFSWTVMQNGVKGAFAGSGSSIAQTLKTKTNANGTVTYTITPSANDCPGEPITVIVTVLQCKPYPPRHFNGKIVRSCHCGHIDITHELSWSPDPNIKGFLLYQNGKLIRTFSAKIGHFSLAHRSAFQFYTYTLVGFNADGVKSKPVKVTLP